MNFQTFSKCNVMVFAVKEDLFWEAEICLSDSVSSEQTVTKTNFSQFLDCVIDNYQF